MTRLFKFLRRVFCRHKGDATFVRNTHGDEIDREWGGDRSVWHCHVCGGLFSKRKFHEESK